MCDQILQFCRVVDGTASGVSSVQWSDGSQEPLHCTSNSTTEVDIFLLDLAAQVGTGYFACCSDSADFLQIRPPPLFFNMSN
jgi:hypothetical protein